jgi:hypothetical protein
MRVRAEAKNAPADPIMARIAVGFSGEFVQPTCACSGRVTHRRRAKPSNLMVDLCMQESFMIEWYWIEQRVNHCGDIIFSNRTKMKHVLRFGS